MSARALRAAATTTLATAVAMCVALAPATGHSESSPSGAVSAGRTWSEKVVYVAPGASGASSLWMAGPDGSDPVELTPGWPGDVADPAIAPDGDSIAFSYFVDGRESIGTIPPAPTAKRDATLLRAQAAYPSWSPTGSRMAYIGTAPDGSRQVMTMRVDGSSPRQVTHLDALAGPWQPAWSPETGQIAYQRQPAGGAGCLVGYFNSWVYFTQVWLVGVDGSDNHPLLPETDHAQAWPDWTPYGTDLAMSDASYTLDHSVDPPLCEGDQVWRVMTLPYDGSSDPVSLWPGTQPAWSADGTRIFFTDVLGQPVGPKLTVMWKDGTLATRLGHFGTDVHAGRVQPHRGLTHTAVHARRGDRRVHVHGRVTPPPGLAYVSATLERRAHGLWHRVDSDQVLLTDGRHFRTALDRATHAGACRVRVSYGGDGWHRPSHRTVHLDC